MPDNPLTPDSRSYPSRRSLRLAADAAESVRDVQMKSSEPSPSEEVNFEAPIGSLVKRAAGRSRFRKLLVVTSATMAAGALAISSITPALDIPGNEPTAAGAVTTNQLLSLDGIPFESADATFDAINTVEATSAPLSAPNEQGLIDPNSLENSKVRYPFDQEIRLTDPFGYRTAPVEQFHDAQDMAAPHGTPIRAIASGVVLEAGFANDGCGFSLKLQHLVDDQTLTSRYCHMANNSHSYQVGDTIKIGDLAGQVGNTGMSFGPHLHLALRLNGEAIDPMPYLAKMAKS